MSTLSVVAIVALVVAGLVSFGQAANANGVALANGDVLAATGNGQVKNFSSAGVLQDTLDDSSLSTYTTGMCFDAAGHLYVTNFSTGTISEFDAGGNLLQATWATFAGNPESCTFNAAGDMFVGGPFSALQEFDNTGTLINTFTATAAGTDWIDLSADQCTMLYHPELGEIDSVNVCTQAANPTFASGLPGLCYQLRIRPNGEVMTACSSEVVRLDSAGNVLQTYPVSSSLFAMNLDPDNTTFWTGDDVTGTIYHVDIATGNILGQFNSNASTGLFGLTIVGGIVVSLPSLALTPATGTASVGTTHTVTATITNPGGSLSGQTVNFTVTGANTASGTGTTDASGQATFTYTGTNAGNDTITASFGTASDTATMTWTAVATNQPPTITGAGGTVVYSDAITPFNITYGDPEATDTLTVSASGLPAGLTLTDNHNGTATVAGTDTAVPGSYPVTYTVNDGHNPDVTDTGTVTVTKETCVLTQPITIQSSATGTTTLTANFGENDTSFGNRTGKTVTFAVSDGTTTTNYTGTTAANGDVSVTLALGAGVYSYTVSFPGDDYYTACATPSGGDTIVTVAPAGFKVTGGGWIPINGGGHTSFGFNAVSDVAGLHGQIEVRSNKSRFHGTTVLTLGGSGNNATWTGTGMWNGVTGYTFTVSVVDNGSSGARKGDTITIVIKDSHNNTVLSTGGAQTLKGGNIIVH